jgi:hypothetical protein
MLRRIPSGGVSSTLGPRVFWRSFECDSLETHWRRRFGKRSLIRMFGVGVDELRFIIYS